MSSEVVGLTLVWGGAALTLVLSIRALVTSEADRRVRLLALGAFGVALVTSFFVGPPPGESLTMPLSVAFFSVMLLLFVTVIEGTHLRKRP
jgi:hypothetical protein